MQGTFLRGVAALAIALSGVLATAAPAAAGGIVVNSLADTVSSSDGKCTLREAITAANTDTKSGATRGECPAGSGTDTITFSVKGTITLLSTRLPEISASLVVDGGKAITVVAAGSASIFMTQPAATVTLKGLTLHGGSVSYGGAIFADGHVTVADMVVTGGVASGAGGGLVASNGSVVTVRDSFFAGNSAGAGGAIHMNLSGSLTVIRSTFSGNSATFGAAVQSDGASMTIANSTFAGNGGEQGGAVYAGQASAITILNTTVSGNTATVSGGGLYVGDAATVMVKNSIIAANTAPSDSDVHGTIDTSLKNLVGVDTTALLAPLGAYGGSTQTMALLSTASTAIDKGDGATCAASPVSGADQRGLPRPSACDIGAVERDKTAPTATTPKATLRTNVSLDGTSLGVHLAWGGSDNANGSGVDHYVLAQSTNGDSFATIASSVSARSFNLPLAPSKTYRFRVRAVDRDGNASGWVAGPTFSTKLTQQTGATFSAGWATKTDPLASGGSTRAATKAGAWAKYSFTARSFALVTTVGPGRGKVKVYVDGVLRSTVDLGGALTYRKQVYQRTWTSSGTHTVKLVVVGTSGRPRVDVDAFARLR
jgi:CSLREA domain-containing protein